MYTGTSHASRILYCSSGSTRGFYLCLTNGGRSFSVNYFGFSSSVNKGMTKENLLLNPSKRRILGNAFTLRPKQSATLSFHNDQGCRVYGHLLVILPRPRLPTPRASDLPLRVPTTYSSTASPRFEERVSLTLRVTRRTLLCEI